MEAFLTYLLSTNPNINDVAEVTKYYEKVYQPISHLVPIPALVSDIYNHVNIKRPENWTVPLKYYNILLPDFYTHLRYVIYNGPPNTLYADYTEPVRTEDQIAKAVVTCKWGMYCNIINPSITVMAAYCSISSYHLDEIYNPPKQLVACCMAEDYTLYPKYKTFFPDVTEALKVNARIIRYIDNPKNEWKLEVIKRDLASLNDIKEQTVEVCELAAQMLHDNSKEHFKMVLRDDPWVGNDVLMGIAYIKLFTGQDCGFLGKTRSWQYPISVKDFHIFNDKIVDLLIKVPKFIFKLTDIPTQYWTQDRLRTVLKTNPKILESYPDERLIPDDGYEIAWKSDPLVYPYIPKEYRTVEMTQMVKQTYPLLIKEAAKKDKKIEDARMMQKWKDALEGKVVMTQALCDDIFAIDAGQYQYIPDEHQTAVMLNYIKQQRYKLLPYVKHLTREDCEEVMAKFPDAIRYVPEKWHTKEMGMLAIKSDKRNLQWCYVITKEMLDFIFKSATGPRKERFNFLRTCDELALLRILKVRPSLIMYLDAKQQTDTLVRQVLEWDGYCYQYIQNKSLEYLKIALESQPKAIKYAGNLLESVS